MAITTYAELKTELQNYLDRDDYDEDLLIDLAEARHKTDVRIREMIARSTASVTTRFASLPSGFLEMMQMRLLTDPVTVLEEINLHEMTRVRKETTGKPEWFVVHGEIEFNKTPDDPYTAEMIYYKELTALSSSNTSNAILSRSPGLYLYAALLEAESYGFNDERIPTWEKLYIASRDRINAMDRKRGGPLVSRVVGATP